MVQDQNTSLLYSPGEIGTYLALRNSERCPARAPGNHLRWRFSTQGKESSAWKSRTGAMVFVSDSFRTKLVSILSAAANGDHPPSFVVTSSLPIECKTTVGGNLGMALAEIGKQVID